MDWSSPSIRLLSSEFIKLSILVLELTIVVVVIITTKTKKIF